MTPRELTERIERVLPNTMSRWHESRPLVGSLIAAAKAEWEAEAKELCAKQMLEFHERSLDDLAARKPEAPASEWGPWEASERIDPATQTEAAVWGSDGDMVCMVCGGYEGGEFVDGLTRAKAIAALSRAPRAESNKP